MKVFLKTINSYLSNDNLETPLDEWLQDPAEGDKIQERLDLILVMEDPDNSSMGAMKKMTNILLSVCEFADVKIGLPDNEYLACDAKLIGLANKVIRGEVSKEYALNLIEEVIKKNSELTEHAITFYSKEPGENSCSGLLTLFGAHAFNNAVDEVQFDTAMEEAGEQRLEVVLRVNPNLEARGEFPTLEGGYTNAMNLFTEIKNLKD